MAKTETKKVVKKETTKKVELKKEEVVKEKKPINKKIIIGSAIGLVVIIIFIVLSITIFFNKERIVTNKVKKMGGEYYTEYFYDALTEGRNKKEVTSILSRYEGIGIKISLDNLSNVFSGKFREEIKTLGSKNKKCNSKNTKAILYPKKPYGKNDFEIKVELDCGF